MMPVIEEYFESIDAILRPTKLKKIESRTFKSG